MTVLITGNIVLYVERLRIKKRMRLRTIGIMDMKVVMIIITTRKYAVVVTHIYHKQHDFDWSTVVNTVKAWKCHRYACKNCHETRCASCTHNGNVISCTNYGTCDVCGAVYTAEESHRLDAFGLCTTCGYKAFNIVESNFKYLDDFSGGTFTLKIKPLYDNIDFNSVFWWATPVFTGTFSGNSGTTGLCSKGKGYTLDSDGVTRIYKWNFTFNNDNKTTYYLCLRPTINGTEYVCEYSYAFSIYRDHQAPVQNDIIQKDQASANGWATIKQLTLTGTENTSDTVYLTISDKASGEKYVTDAAVSVTDGKYSYTCTPSIEGDANGRIYVVTAKDVNGNTSTKEFAVSKTDGSAPQLKSGTSLSYTDWTNIAKNISLSFFDFGAGGVEASLDNQTDYKPLTKSGEYYIWNHSFGNQIGTTEHTIYVRDALGNANSYTFTVGNTDSNVYSITYNLNSGTISDQKTSYTVADSFTLPQPTKTGYTFTGWTGSNGTTPQKIVTVNKGTRGNLSYIANWSANQYTVSYDANGGTGTMDTDTATYNENYVTKANQFTRTGYEFVGWTENADGSGSNWTSWIGKPWKWTYTKNITLYAKWKPQTYTITYEPNGGVGDSFTQTATYNEIFTTAENRFTKTGYSFVGWRSDKTSRWAKISTTDLGQWGYKENTVKFYDYANNKWITYDLWYWRGSYNAASNCVADNDTLKAQWRANDYTVTLDYKKNISSSYEKAIVATYDSAYGKLPQPVLPGWTFKGWNTKADGTGVTITEDTVYKTVGDSTLYSQWSYDPVSVKVPQVLTGDHTGRSQFRVKCDDLKAGNIKVAVPNSFPYKQTGKSDVTASINSKSGNNIITPANKVCVYDITAKSGLSAGCWRGSFNIGLTLTKE